MAPRKAPAAAPTDVIAPAPSQRPRRGSASYRTEPSAEVIGNNKCESSSSGEESGLENAPAQHRNVRSRAKQPPTLAKSAAPAAAGSRGATKSQRASTAAGAPRGRPPRAAAVVRTQSTQLEHSKPAADRATDSESDSGFASDGVHGVDPGDKQEVTEVQDTQQEQPPARSTRLRPAAAHTTAKGPIVLPPPPVAQVRRRTAGEKTAAPKANGASADSIAGKASTAPSLERTRRGQRRVVAAPGNDDGDRAEDSEEQDAQEEEEEEEDDEEEGQQQQQEEGEEAEKNATSGAVNGKSKPPPVPPTTVESRKRLFELLERRIGAAVTTTDTSGGLMVYSSLPVKNANKKAKLLTNLRSQFDDWISRLRSNFSIMLHGFGSKRALLDDFARLLAGPRNRGDAAVLVFHGYNARCTAREVVTGVAGALMQRTFKNVGAGGGAPSAAASAPPGPGAAASTGAHAALRALVADIRREPRSRHAFAVIHNIDGPGLRGDMPLLSELAACPQVHVLASTDHAMAPMLWDSADAARFRWQYINATTYLPYIVETSQAPPLLMDVFKSGVVTAGAGTVLRSLVLGAQEVFKVLAEHLLEDEECEGVAFAHLYRMCKERYLVRDEGVLRQHLVEFVDHQLLRVRPASDSSGELLTIPMSRADMQAVLDDLQAARGE